jgi:hypothetical protein
MVGIELQKAGARLVAAAHVRDERVDRRAARGAGLCRMGKPRRVPADQPEHHVGPCKLNRERAADAARNSADDVDTLLRLGSAFIDAVISLSYQAANATLQGISIILDATPSRGAKLTGRENVKFVARTGARSRSGSARTAGVTLRRS